MAGGCGRFLWRDGELRLSPGLHVRNIPQASQREFGWSRESISTAFGIAAMTVAVCSPVLGRLLDRYGGRPVVLSCMAVFGLAFGSLSFPTPSLAHLYATFFVLGVVGNGTTQMGYSRAVSSWFTGKRGRALAPVVAGVGVGSDRALLAVRLQNKITMNLSNSKLYLSFLAICSASVAQTGNYFPLETGNAWMYSLSGGGTTTAFKTISVEGRETVRGFDYSRVRYFDEIVYLRATPDGSIVSFNRTTGTDELWLKLTDPVGTTFESLIDQCTNMGRIDERGAEVVTPAGRFADTVQFGFQGNCADAGTTRQIYAAGVGPAVHEETSFAGPRRYELIYFRTASGGGTELSFTIGIDAPTYQPGSNMAVRLTLRSTHPDAVKLQFTSGQSFDLKIYDESGSTVYVWSADKLFIQIIRAEQFGPGERTYAFPVPLGTLRPGRYKVQGYLATSPRLYVGETSFEIVP